MNWIHFTIIMYAILVAVIAATLSFIVSFLLFKNKKFSFRRMMITALSGECMGFIILLLIIVLNKQKYPGPHVPDVLMGLPFYCMLAGAVAGIIWISRDRTGYW